MKKIFETFLNKSGKEKITIVVLIGVLLLVIMIPTGKSSTQANDSTSSGGTKDSAYDNSTFSYESYIENKLETALGKVDGVGSVKAVVTLKSTGEKVLAKDSEQSGSSTSETNQDGSVRDQSTYNSSDTHILVENGDVPYVTLQNMPEIEGVVIVAKGGGDGNVATEITQAVEALLGIPAHKIKVLKMS